MRSPFQIQLVNGYFGDPLVLVELMFEGRSLLFDLGECGSLSPKSLLKVESIFITHTHIDHFIGFDTILRMNLHRDRVLRLYGPPGLIDNVRGRLAGYTWNLVTDYSLVVEVHELHEDRRRAVRFQCAREFRSDPLAETPFDGTALDEELMTVRATHLDHIITSMAYAIEEKVHVNIRKNVLDEMGIAVGPWIGEFKRSLRAGGDGREKIEVPVGDPGEGSRIVPLHRLAEDAAFVTDGMKISYVSDCRFTPRNVERIVDLVTGSDVLYCEASFLHEEADRAWERYHLTSRQAGEIARVAGVKRLEVFHVSQRYQPDPEPLVREAREAFEAGPGE